MKSAYSIATWKRPAQNLRKVQSQKKIIKRKKLKFIKLSLRKIIVTQFFSSFNHHVWMTYRCTHFVIDWEMNRVIAVSSSHIIDFSFSPFAHSLSEKIMLSLTYINITRTCLTQQRRLPWLWRDGAAKQKLNF